MNDITTTTNTRHTVYFENRPTLGELRWALDLFVNDHPNPNDDTGRTVTVDLDSKHGGISRIHIEDGIQIGRLT